MAQYWTPAGSFQTVHVVSQTSAPDVEAVGIYTKPSNIYMVALVPLSAWQSGDYATYLDTPALLVESILADFGLLPPAGGQLVTGAQYVQREDANGLLSGFMDFTVTYVQPNPPGGTFSGTVRVPMTDLESLEAFAAAEAAGTGPGQIKPEYDRLVALANS